MYPTNLALECPTPRLNIVISESIKRKSHPTTKLLSAWILPIPENGWRRSGTDLCENSGQSVIAGATGKRLKGFKRVTIPCGQSKTVSIEIDCADLWFWDAENDKITFDQGKYIFEIGASSKDIRGNVEATMSGAYKPVLTTVVAESDLSVLETLKNNRDFSFSSLVG